MILAVLQQRGGIGGLARLGDLQPPPSAGSGSPSRPRTWPLLLALASATVNEPLAAEGVVAIGEVGLAGRGAAGDAACGAGWPRPRGWASRRRWSRRIPDGKEYGGGNLPGSRRRSGRRARCAPRVAGDRGRPPRWQVAGGTVRRPPGTGASRHGRAHGTGHIAAATGSTGTLGTSGGPAGSRRRRMTTAAGTSGRTAPQDRTGAARSRTAATARERSSAETGPTDRCLRAPPCRAATVARAPRCATAWSASCAGNTGAPDRARLRQGRREHLHRRVRARRRVLRHRGCASCARWTAPWCSAPTAPASSAPGVQLVPDPSIPTEESGTRHRTAERVARQTGYPVISVSSPCGIIALYLRRPARTCWRTPAPSCPRPTRPWPPWSATSSGWTRSPARCRRWRSRTW